MNKIVSVLKKYMYVVAIFLTMSIILSVSFSNFIVTSNNHKAAEMYIGSLKYSIEIDSNETNTLTVEPGVTVIDVDVNNLNPVDTYYKLLYLNNSNLEIKYFSETKDTDEIKTSYKSPNDSVTSNNTNNLKLFIRNNSDTNQEVSFSLKGGYINNTLSDISVPSGYSEITNIETPSSNTYFCKTSDTLTQGLEYVNGQYTYGYKKEGTYVSSGLAWTNISNNGWGVQLTDKTSTDAVTSKLCTYVNNKPVISYSYMFYNSEATTIDLSNFDTSNVTYMDNMFFNSQATTLDLSNFDTSKVTNMAFMFGGSKATTLDVSNFDTSKVTYMAFMFFGSQATTLDVSHFDTSNVTNMAGMFANSQATSLDLSNFDTSNVKNMPDMFNNSQATTLDVSHFDTSNVTNMAGMFANSQATSLDLSNFDTSKVTNTSYMFQSSTNLKTIYTSDKFNTDNVTSSSQMFYDSTNLVGGAGTTYNSSYTDKTYARIDGGSSNPGYFTDVSQKPSTFDTDDWATIVKSVKAGNTRKYKVGDTKEVDLGTTYGTHTLRIANTSTSSECSTSGFSQTACGFVLEFADIITYHAMNEVYQTNDGGWPATSMRTFVNNDIYNSLPSDLRTGIIDTTVVSGHGSTSGETNFTSTDKLYLLSTAEVYTRGLSYDTATSSTRQLDYYKNLGVTTSSYNGAIKSYGTKNYFWWLRSANVNNDIKFISVSYYNGSGGNYADATYGVSPAFRIG